MDRANRNAEKWRCFSGVATTTHICFSDTRNETMKKIILRARRIVRGEEGASLVEYGLLLGLIAVVCLAAVTLLGNNIAALFNQIATAL
jgi:pilus assembly protein Flp/PilA